jgi:Glycosyltransferase family 87
LHETVDTAIVTAVPPNVEPPRAVSVGTSKAGPARSILYALSVLNIIVLLLMALGVAAKWQAGPPKGKSVIDFTTYYSGGRMAGVDHGAHLYDLVAQAKDQTALVGIRFNPAAKRLQVVGFVNPPTSTLLLRPLSLLPLTSAYRVWMLFEVVLLVAAGWLILQTSVANRSDSQRPTALDFALPSLAMAAAFPVGAALIQGSLTPLVVLGFALFAKGVISHRNTDADGPSARLRSNADLLVTTGLLLIGMKPQYVLLPLAVLLGLRRFKALGLTAFGQLMLMALSTLIVQPSAWIDYFKLLGTYNREIDTYGSSTSSMINVRGILASWLGASNASTINTISSALLVAVVIGIGFLAHRSHEAQSTKHSSQNSQRRTVLVIAMLLAGLIASPHAHSHDWTIALVALALAWFLPTMTTVKRCVLTLVPLVSFVTMSSVGSAVGKAPVLVAAVFLVAAIGRIFRVPAPVDSVPTTSNR